METKVKRWVRLGIGVTLAAPQVVIGLWAVLAPKHWFESFPGFDPRLVAANPPYNEHLAADVGAGFLATGVALLVAAVWANRAAVGMALLTFGTFTVPHVAYHAANPSDALSGAEDAINTLTLFSGLVLVALFGWGLRRARPEATSASSTTIAMPGHAA